MTLLAQETDEDHIHVVVSAPPRFSPALIANLVKGYSSRSLREQYPTSKRCVARGIFGRAATMSAWRGPFQRKSSPATLQHVRGNSRAGCGGPPHPNPPKRTIAVIQSHEWRRDVPRRFVNAKHGSSVDGCTELGHHDRGRDSPRSRVSGIHVAHLLRRRLVLARDTRCGDSQRKQRQGLQIVDGVGFASGSHITKLLARPLVGGAAVAEPDDTRRERNKGSAGVGRAP